MTDWIFTLIAVLGMVGGAELVRSTCRRWLLTPRREIVARAPQDRLAADLAPEVGDLVPHRAAA